MPWVEIIDKETGRPTGFFLWEGPMTDEVRDMVNDVITRPPVQVAVRRPPNRHLNDVDTPPTATARQQPPADDPSRTRVPIDQNTAEPPIAATDATLLAEDGMPMENTPGYLGIVFDGDFLPGPELAVLGGFDWHTYEELVAVRRHLVLSGLPKTVNCEVDPYFDLAEILGQLPSVDAVPHLGPEDSPTAGSGSIFVLATGANVHQVEREAQTLRDALDVDLLELGGVPTDPDECD